MSDWPCPTDLSEGEKVELYDSVSGTFSAKVVDIINGVISVSIDSFMNTVVSIDPYYTKWRRLGPAITYGVRCTDRFCNEWFEHAVAVPNFKCYSCRKR